MASIIPADRSIAKTIRPALVLSAVFFLAFLASGKGYRTGIEFLAIPRNGAMAENPEATVGDLRKIILSRSFFQSVNDRVSEIPGTEEVSHAERNRVWSETVAVEPEKDSHAFRISVFAKDSNDSQEIAQAVSDNLIGTFGNYYDIRTELDLRIMDGPETQSSERQSLWLSVLYALVSGMASYAVIFRLIPWVYLERNDTGEEARNDSGKRKAAWKKISFNFPKKAIPEKEEERYAFPETESETGKASDPLPEETASIMPKAAKAGSAVADSKGKGFHGPENLPVAEEEIPDFVLKAAASPMSRSDKETTGSHDDAAPAKKPDTSREASQEEVKARLNRLLGGEL